MTAGFIGNPCNQCVGQKVFHFMGLIACEDGLHNTGHSIVESQKIDIRISMDFSLVYIIAI